MNTEYTTLKITANNHPGVMSHITGLFSRRGFNIEGILCSPISQKTLSKIIVLIREDQRTSQIIKQLMKLYDVKEVTKLADFDTSFFLSEV